MNINYRLAPPQVNEFSQNVVFNGLLGSACLPTFGTFSLESTKGPSLHSCTTDVFFKCFTLLVGVWFVYMV